MIYILYYIVYVYIYTHYSIYIFPFPIASSSYSPKFLLLIQAGFRWQVLVYPHLKTKPEVGVGLNKAGAD